MKVIPKQTEYYVIHLDYSEEMYINLGKYLEKNVNYKLEKDYTRSNKKVILLMEHKEIEIERYDYLLIGVNDNNNLLYVENEKFKENYIEIKE